MMIQGKFHALEHMHEKSNAAKKSGYIAAGMDQVASLFGRGQKASDSGKIKMKDSASYSAPSVANLDSLGPNAPESVLTAWKQTVKETGINGLRDGSPTHLSALLAMQQEKRNTTGSADILGSTVESARAAIKKALTKMDEQSGTKVNTKVQEYQRKEREFYNKLLANLAQA